MALTALAVALIVAGVLTYITWGQLDVTLGDTDDATRLVLMRRLIEGAGWWNQHLMRFQPPVGVYMHWSQLLTGAIAAVDEAFRLVLSADDAETATRFTWPLLWIFPAALAALMIARRLGAGLMGGAVVLVCAILLASDVFLYVQFHPGRVDHHDVQMTLCMLALAGAVQPRPNLRGAVLTGVATGLGLAVGLEAILYDAIIGAGLALRFVADRREARAAGAYGLTLLATTALAFLIQTPPGRWGVSACDDIGVNLTAAVVVAGAGLTAAVRLSRSRSWPVRLAALAIAGAAAGAVYFGLDPDCRHGFFANVDPRIRPIWLNFVQEVRPIDKIWKRDQVQAAGLIAPWVVGVVAWLLLGLRRARWTDPAWLIPGACLLPAVAVAAGAIRMTGYAEWFAVPIVATLAVEAARRYERGRLIAVLLAGAVASPLVSSGLAQGAVKLTQHKKPAASAKAKTPRDACFDTDAYDALADAEPSGLVLSEVDLGPFILANTDDAVIAGPYHRLGWGILRAHALLGQPADAAAPAVRQAGVAYVVECRFHARHGDRERLGKDSLQKRLDRGQPPAWLKPLSDKDDPLQVYRVSAASPVAPAPRPAGAIPPARTR